MLYTKPMANILSKSLDIAPTLLFGRELLLWPSLNETILCTNKDHAKASIRRWASRRGPPSEEVVIEARLDEDGVFRLSFVSAHV